MIDKSKLLVLRNNIDTYLAKMAERDDKQNNQVLDSVRKIRDELKITIDASKPDLNGLVKSIDRLVTSVVNHPITVMPPDISGVERAIGGLGKLLIPKGKQSDEEVVKVLRRLENILSAKPQEVKDRTDDLIKAIKETKTITEFPDSISINNFPPQKVPQPVTNININPLRGFIHTTAATVTSTLTPLPTYGVLDNRRSIMVFNNDASTTIYIGGSDVTTSNGLPVLAQSYSPSIDAGKRMILYGVASGSVNVRVIEISNEAIGG